MEFSRLLHKGVNLDLILQKNMQQLVKDSVYCWMKTLPLMDRIYNKKQLNKITK